MKDSFASLLAVIAFFAVRVRNFWMKLLKKRIPFIAIAHDHWDSLSDDVLGGNVSFADPISREFLNFASFLELVFGQEVTGYSYYG